MSNSTKPHSKNPRRHKLTQVDNRDGECLWRGPKTDGITFSMLSDFLVCKERFRLKVVEGLEEPMGFNHSIEYGNYFHECEEARFNDRPWMDALRAYRDKLIDIHGTDIQEDINKWAAICKHQFPLYVAYWKKKEKNYNHLLEEQNFEVPYVLPSGRIINLRGKIDGVLTIGSGDKPNVFIQENKTKGFIDSEAITSTMLFNLQPMLYFIAAQEIISRVKKYTETRKDKLMIPPSWEGWPSKMPSGILYNVIRRPLSDKYAIRIKKSETKTDFYKRVGQNIAENLEYYFQRHKVLVHNENVKDFKTKVFHPLLEHLCDWWEYIAEDPYHPWRSANNPHSQLHYQTPWGMFNSMFGGFRGDYYEYLTTGSKTKLKPIASLFPELE